MPRAKTKPDAPPAAIEIGGLRIEPGHRAHVDLPVSLLSDHTPVTLPLQVVHGKHPGARLFVSAAVHGDEINGVEIIRRLLRHRALRALRGTLIAIPIVNVYGFIGRTRYLPDRRDLNRSFPGSPRGSLAAQLAHLFMGEVVNKCTHGIDIHTGAVHRANFPQVRADVADAEVARLARAFGAPVIVNATVRDGSLRQAALERGVRMLLYEAGEALRFDPVAIRAGVHGIVRVMQTLGMIQTTLAKPKLRPVVARSASWIRAPAGGILRTPCRLGARIRKHDRVGIIADPLGQRELEVRAERGGIVIGRTNLPVVNQGDALFHVARFANADTAAEAVETFHDRLEAEAMPSEFWD